MRRFPKRSPRPKSQQSGITLLEVLLALAILAGAIATLGEILRNGGRNAQQARELTRAQLLCESKMDEILAEIDLPTAITQTALDSEDVLDDEIGWLYSVEVEQIDQQYLVSVRVTVEQNLDRRPASYSLVRWVFDPDHLIMEEEELEEEDASADDVAAGGDRG